MNFAWWLMKGQDTGSQRWWNEGNTKPWMLNKSWTIWGMDGFSFSVFLMCCGWTQQELFEVEMERMCDEYDIYLDLIPGEAHWQLGSCEQAVQGAKEVMTKLAEQDPERDPQELLSVAVKTFNEREMVRGFSPCQHVLGRAFDETGRFIHPETTNGIDLMVPNPGEECIEGIQLRKRAEQALSEWQASQRVNRGMQSRAKPKYNYHAGDLVYFWRKQVSGQKPGKNGMFLGPARVSATETKRDSEGNLAPSSSVWLVRGRRLVKCCPEQLRPASEREELLEFLGNPESHQETWDFSRVASALGLGWKRTGWY